MRTCTTKGRRSVIRVLSVGVLPICLLFAPLSLANADPQLSTPVSVQAAKYPKKDVKQFWRFIKKENKLTRAERRLTVRLGKATCNALRDGATLEDLAMAVGPNVLLEDDEGIMVIAAAGRFLCPDQSSKFR